MATGAGNKPVPFRMECVSADGRCTQPVNPDRSVLPDGRFLRFENEGNSQQPQGECDERRHHHYQQRQVCDQLKLLRGMAVAGIIRGTGERMRVNIDMPVDIVSMGKQRNRTPVPCEEYQ